MRNRDLARDYLKRSSARLAAIDVLFERKSWADVVREAQEVVELSLKGLLRAYGVEPPRVHDVSDVLIANADRFPQEIASRLDDLVEVSRRLRLSRELAFYGAEDLTPSDFYGADDAESARAGARLVVESVSPHIS